MTTSNGDPFSVADVNLVSLISTSFALFFFCWYWLLALLSFFSKLCFRAWLHDTKLELYSVQKDKRIVVKHFTIWKKRIALNTIATELVRAFYFLMFMSSDNENANLWVQICFALTDYTLNCIVDGSVSRQHVSSSLETWWRDNFKALFFYWKTLLLSIHCDILLSPELLLSFRFLVGWSTCLRKILDKMASSADKETSFSNDDETRREKAAVGGKLFSKGPLPASCLEGQDRVTLYLVIDSLQKLLDAVAMRIFPSITNNFWLRYCPSVFSWTSFLHCFVVPPVFPRFSIVSFSRHNACCHLCSVLYTSIYVLRFHKRSSGWLHK